MRYFTGDKNIINRGSEGCVVISCLLDKVLSFTWNTPPKFMELRNSGYKTVVVIEFIEKSESSTRGKIN